MFFDQDVNTVEGNNHSLFRDLYKTYKFSVWRERRIYKMLNMVVHTVTTGLRRVSSCKVTAVQGAANEIKQSNIN